MPVKLISHVAAGLPSAIDVNAQLLLAVKSVYPAATTAYPWATLKTLDQAPGGLAQTVLTVRVTYPG